MAQAKYPMLVAEEGPLKGQRWACEPALVVGRGGSCEVVSRIAGRDFMRA
jgi:hypothetical protein